MSKRTMTILSECIPVFTMLQDENRQQILMLLFDHKKMTVNELTDQLSLSRPAVSHHLKLLLDSGLRERTSLPPLYGSSSKTAAKSVKFNGRRHEYNA